MRRFLKIAAAVIAIALAILVIVAFVAGPGMVERSMNRVAGNRAYPVPEAARRLHDTLLVADLHDDLLLWDRDPLARSDRGHTDIPRLIAGRVALQVFGAVTKVPAGQNTTVPFDASGLDQITAALIDAGFTEREIRLIMGENVVRLLGQALPKGGLAP